ncbi:DUF1629 domain-containing protein [uncultured Tyzzerella sp.]|uniref:imm11 family protein n=1 Tax=uncultured Tyzzerella sp. TaxID=2321398 RepID=UPI0029434B3D|nr:DUF1629 domain-containing protein [uncultured Tyzzerella sp.]
MKYYEMTYDYEKAEKYDYLMCTSSSLEDKYGYYIENSELNNYLGEDKIDVMHTVISGFKVKKFWEKTTLYYSPLENNNLEIFTDFLNNSYGWVLVSDKFIKLTEKYIKGEVEYLDVYVENKDNKNIREDYKIINIIKVLDALDLQNSIYHSIDKEGYIFGLKKYALNNDIVKGSNIFRLHNQIDIIFVSENIKNVIEENNLTGFNFKEVKLV